MNQFTITSRRNSFEDINQLAVVFRCHHFKSIDRYHLNAARHCTIFDYI